MTEFLADQPTNKIPAAATTGPVYTLPPPTSTKGRILAVTTYCREVFTVELAAIMKAVAMRAVDSFDWQTEAELAIDKANRLADAEDMGIVAISTLERVEFTFTLDEDNGGSAE